MQLPILEITSEQIRKSADICADVGQVCLAVIVVPSFLQLVDPVIAIVGTIATAPLN